MIKRLNSAVFDLGESHAGKVVVRIITVAASLGAVALLWSRTGKIPAASVGDDVWWNESAFWLLKHGSLVRHMHPDIVLSNVRDLVNPMLSLIQAFSFYLLGMNQFSAGLSVSICLSLTIAALVLQSSLPLWQRFGFSTLVVANPFAIRYGLQVRPEAIYTAVLLVLAALPSITARVKIGPLRFGIIAAILASVAALSYYPVGPASVAIGFCTTRLYPRYSEITTSANLKASNKATIGYLLAGMICMVTFIAWIHPSYGLLINQLVANATSKHYSGLSMDLYAAVSLLTLIAFYALSRRFYNVPQLRILAASGVLLACSAPLCGVHLHFPLYVFMLACCLQTFQGVRNSILNLAAPAAAIASLIALSAVFVIRGGGGRDYNTYKEELIGEVHNSGVLKSGKCIVIDNTPHLALRPLVASNQLIHATLGGGASSANYAVPLLSSGHEIGLVIGTEQALERWRELYPSVRYFMESRSIRKIEIGDAPPYQSLMLIPSGIRDE